MKRLSRKLLSLSVGLSLFAPLSQASSLTIAQPTSATAMDPGFL
ncbi:peptide ABC transporter substrate-binding protein, partial [Cronobacter sakazakii]